MSLKKMAEKMSFRWAFQVSSWKPVESEIVLAGACIQPEEKARISKFVYKQDFKSALIGRLMMRKFVHDSTGIPYSDVVLVRDKNGKPILQKPKEFPSVDFNISHQGDFVVLAGQLGNKKVGIDVMNKIPPVGKNVSEFFRLMRRQFSPTEWENIKSFDSEVDQLSAFYRHWCLKESYVKNIGVGITVDLQSISFKVNSGPVQKSQFTVDTELTVSGKPITDWIFEESLIDSNHGVAVALSLAGESYDGPTPFKFLTFEQLMVNSMPFVEQDKKFYEDFVHKDEKHY